MSIKQPTLVNQKARELAEAIKEEVLQKLKPGKWIYRSYDMSKFFTLSNNILTSVVLDKNTDYYRII